MKIRLLSIVLVAAALAACTNGSNNGVRIVSGGSSASGKPQPQAIRNFTGAEIYGAIVGKTFQYTRSDGNGFVTYNADGTFEFQDDTRGAGKGRWVVNGNQFCETFGANAQTDCGDFKNTGDAYFAAKSRLVEMKT